MFWLCKLDSHNEGWSSVGPMQGTQIPLLYRDLHCMCPCWGSHWALCLWAPPYGKWDYSSKSPVTQFCQLKQRRMSTGSRFTSVWGKKKAARILSEKPTKPFWVYSVRKEGGREGKLFQPCIIYFSKRKGRTSFSHWHLFNWRIPGSARRRIWEARRDEAFPKQRIRGQVTKTDGWQRFVLPHAQTDIRCPPSVH